MFGNGDGVQRDSEALTIYMGKNMEFKGTLHFEGTGRIDGNVEGKLKVKGVLFIGEGATVSSEIESDTVVIGGRVDGKVVGRRKVQLLKTAVVNADIVTPSFSIEEGSQFNGSCNMSGRADAESSDEDSERDEKRRTAMAAS